jgi:Domain of unknown function (DUF4266)
LGEDAPAAECLQRAARTRFNLESTPAMPRVLLLLMLTTLGGCAQLPSVRAWEKGMLAKPEMTFEYDRLDTAFAEHTYTSKEAASGGSSAAGGGCGCN